MAKKDNNDPKKQTVDKTEKDSNVVTDKVEAKVSESETADVKKEQHAESTEAQSGSHINSDMLVRILLALIFALIGWVSLWVFGVVVLVQFGFLLITGSLNKNLKAFNGELGEYLSDIIAFVGFQKDEKPFPFQAWHYDDDKKPENGEPAQ